MEKELDEVFGGGRLLRVPAPTVLPSGYSRYGVPPLRVPAPARRRLRRF